MCRRQPSRREVFDDGLHNARAQGTNAAKHASMVSTYESGTQRTDNRSSKSLIHISAKKEEWVEMLVTFWADTNLDRSTHWCRKASMCSVWSAAAAAMRAGGEGWWPGP